MKRCCATLAIILILTMIVAAAVLANFNPSALPEPGRFETRMANMGKHWMVRRAAARIHAAIPTASNKSVIGGEMTFGDQCAMCHGNDGRSPTAIGKGLYPRALDLGSPEVQQWSNAELFWIIKNGIRLSGMPGFGKSLPDSDISNLVNYVRSVKPASASPQQK